MEGIAVASLLLLRSEETNLSVYSVWYIFSGFIFSLFIVVLKALVTTRVMNILVTCFAHLWQQDLLIVSQSIAGLLTI